MQETVVVVLVLHVLSGVFWAGSTFVLARLGSDQAGHLLTPQLGAAAIAIVTGALLWYLLHGGNAGTSEHVLEVGAVFALVAVVIQGVTAAARQPIPVGPGGETATASTVGRAAVGQRMAAACLAVTVACMAASRYV
jgi:hypothetical protein